MMTAIVQLAGTLGLIAVAEGVESEAQRQFLLDLGCPLAQGYLLGPPAIASAAFDFTQLSNTAGRKMGPGRPSAGQDEYTLT